MKQFYPWFSNIDAPPNCILYVKKDKCVNNIPSNEVKLSCHDSDIHRKGAVNQYSTSPPDQT